MNASVLAVIILLSLIGGCENAPLAPSSEGAAVAAVERKAGGTVSLMAGPPPLDRAAPVRIETATFALG